MQPFVSSKDLVSLTEETELEDASSRTSALAWDDGSREPLCWNSWNHGMSRYSSGHQVNWASRVGCTPTEYDIRGDGGSANREPRTTNREPVTCSTAKRYTAYL